MLEQTKAAKRRSKQQAFVERYFVGAGIDVGAGEDGLSKNKHLFPKITTVREWDMADGDAQYLAGIPPETFDFLHSSHSLEHMQDWKEAMRNWIMVVKKGGFLILTVPDEDMYEQEMWPSEYSDYHNFAFTIYKPHSWCPASVNVIDVVREFGSLVRCEKIELLTDNYQWGVVRDQTFLPDVEAAIEIVLRKI